MSLQPATPRFHVFNTLTEPPHSYSPFEPWHEISNDVVCVPSKASDQPAHMHMRSLIRTFASCLNVL